MDNRFSSGPRPGHLLGPFRWAATPLASIIQTQPNLLKLLFEIDRPRMHVIALGLAHLPADRADQLARTCSPRRFETLWLLSLAGVRLAFLACCTGCRLPY